MTRQTAAPSPEFFTLADALRLPTTHEIERAALHQFRGNAHHQRRLFREIARRNRIARDTNPVEATEAPQVPSGDFRPCVRCGGQVAPFSHLWCAPCADFMFNGPLPGSRGTQR